MRSVLLVTNYLEAVLTSVHIAQSTLPLGGKETTTIRSRAGHNELPLFLGLLAFDIHSMKKCMAPSGGFRPLPLDLLQPPREGDHNGI
jgi:hypothetical protein